jgi:hypothetical protein
LQRLFLLFILIHAQPIIASGLRHVVRESDSGESILTLRGCHSLMEVGNIARCLPVNFIQQAEGEIGLAILLDTNESVVRNVFDLIDRSLEQATLERLFREDSFESASGLGRIRAIFRNVMISHTPLHFAGAYKLSNPTLPKFQFAAVRQRETRLSLSYIWTGKEIGYDIFVSPALFLHDRDFIDASFDALVVPGVEVKSLIKKTKHKAVDGDFALAAMSRMNLAPSISLRLANINSKFACATCETNLIRVDHLYHPRLEWTASSFFDHSLGKSILGLHSEMIESESNIQSPPSTFYAYQISNLTAHIAFSPYQYAFGFIFRSDSYRVGIQYTDEKQDNNLLIDRRKKTYVSLEMGL